MDWDVVGTGRGRWAVLFGSLTLIFLLFGRGSHPVVVSSWGGDAMQQGMVAPPNTALKALFSQQAPKTTNLAADPHPQDQPWGNPYDAANTVVTQGYGVGSHVPATVFGAVDLAIDGTGSGQADAASTMGVPVYATHTGVVKLAANTWPAGNHVWVMGDHWKTGYSHLKGFAVADGATVKRGQVIGYAGSTGESSGPHLDYQVWKDGANVNPLDFGAMP
ncbi:MAG: M23 family metallopeptidase [Herpetosiphon sp.]